MIGPCCCPTDSCPPALPHGRGGAARGAECWGLPGAERAGLPLQRAAPRATGLYDVFGAAGLRQQVRRRGAGCAAASPPPPPPPPGGPPAGVLPPRSQRRAGAQLAFASPAPPLPCTGPPVQLPGLQPSEAAAGGGGLQIPRGAGGVCGERAGPEPALKLPPHSLQLHHGGCARSLRPPPLRGQRPGGTFPLIGVWVTGRRGMR